MKLFIPILLLLLISAGLHATPGDSAAVRLLDNKVAGYMADKPDSALVTLKKALQLTREMNDSLGMLQHENFLGSLLAQYGRYAEAVVHFHQAYSLAILTHRPRAVSSACINLGNVYAIEGKYNVAIGFHLMAIRFMEALKSPYTATSYYCIGAAYHDWGNYPESITYYEKALRLMEMQKDSAGTINTYIALGVSYKELKEYGKAIEFFTKAGSLIALTKNTASKGYNLSAMGETYLLLHKPVLALKYLDSSLVLLHQQNDLKSVAEVYIQLGLTHQALNNNTDAIGYLKKANEIAVNTRAGKLLLDSYQAISGFYKKTGNLTQAIAQIEIYNKLKDSLFTANSSKQIAEMQEKYESEKKAKEINALKRSTAEKDLEAGKQKSVKNILLLILLSAAVLLAGLYNNHKKEKALALKQQELKQQQELHRERTRIARELHDNIGSQLTYIISNIETTGIYVEKANMEKVRSTLDIMGIYARNTMQQLREAIWTMNKERIGLPELKLRIEEYLQKFFADEDTQLLIDWLASINGDLHPLQSLNLFRIIQEAANNCVKYARASRFTVQVEDTQQALVFTIRDDGIGFNPNTNQDGYGLANMKYRASEIGAAVEISSTDGKGTRICLSLNKETLPEAI